MSKLSEVLTNFGFGNREAQKAFIGNLYLAGYLKPQSIWQALNMMQLDKEGRKTEIWELGEQQSFDAMVKDLQKSGATQEDPTKFNPAIFIDSFMNQAAFFNSQNVADMMLYLTQNAFNRNFGQERSELAKQPWSEKFKDAYLANAKQLGLIDEKLPQQQEYDETWIQGAGRFRMQTRMKSAKKYQENKVDLGQVRLLTGDRELWVEIDKLPNELPEDCKNFMSKLAKINRVEIIGFEEREVAGQKRTYPKYAEGEKRKLTETMMAKDVYQQVFQSQLQDEQLVDSVAAAGELRPTTATNAADVTREKLAARIQKNDFANRDPKILIVSNQPYVDRQVVTNERAVLNEMRKLGIAQKIIFEGAGDVCEVGVTAIHSEFGALGNELYMRSKERGQMPKATLNPQQLSFQNRYQKMELLPPMPQISPPSVASPSATRKFISSQAKASTLQ